MAHVTWKDVIFLCIMCCTQLEKHFGNPRDIEFAVGEDDTIYLLQVNVVVNSF